jgi:hypothetical protein
MTTTAMPYTHLGQALATDYLFVREQFSDSEWERFLATRRFVDAEVLPVINDFWERAELPWAAAHPDGGAGRHRRGHRGLRVPGDDAAGRGPGPHGAAPR